jgi:hypothetical protein
LRDIKTDLSRLDEVIARQYEDKIRGIAKDSIQNSWHHRKCNKGKDFRTVFTFYKKLGDEDSVLLIEDDGTKGMGDRQWEAFHYHWKTTSDEYQPGTVSRWGQGKTLFLYFSRTKRILAESVDQNGTYRYSVRTLDKFIQNDDVPEPGDPQWLKRSDGSLKLIQDFFPSVSPLNHQGTRIWIMNVKDELANDIVNGRLLEELSVSWWEIILKFGARIEYQEGAKSLQTGLPTFPSAVDEWESKPASPIAVNHGQGKILKLRLVLTNQDIKESLRGIAIQRGGMTVKRYDSPSIPPEFKSRVYGHCYPDDQLDLELYKIEMANHEDFEPRKSVWVNLRRRVDEEIEKFLAPHTRAPPIKRPEVDVEEILKIVNKIVDDYLGGPGPEGIRTEGIRPPPEVRFEPWTYKGADQRFNPGDVLQHKASVKNSRDRVAEVKVKRWVEDKHGQRYAEYEIRLIRVPKHHYWHLDALPDIDLSSLALGIGEYSLRGVLLDKRDIVLQSRGATFYYGQDPPPPPPLGAPRRGWLKKLIAAPLGGTQAHLRNLPYNQSDGSVVVNEAYPEYKAILSKLSQESKEAVQKRIKQNWINILLEEAAKENLVNAYQKSAPQFSIEQIRLEGKELFDRMWSDYVEGYGVV